MSAFDKLYSLLSQLKHPSQFFNKEFRTMFVITSIGITHGIIYSYDTVLSYIYKDDYKLTPAQSSMFDCTNQIPWMIKPLWGALSDNVTLFGYRRKSYLIIMGLLSLFVYSYLRNSNTSYSYWIYYATFSTECSIILPQYVSQKLL